MKFIRQSTSTDIVIGPIWSTSDGSLKSDLAYNASGINCDGYKNGSKSDISLANSAGDGYFRAGSGEAQYILTLSTGLTDTIGNLRITLSATGYYMAPEEYVVLDEAVYDVLFGTVAPSTLTQTNVTGGAYDVTNASCLVHLAADQAVNASKIGGQTANAAGAVTFPGTIASTTNITAASGISLAASQHVIVDSGTVTTLTNTPGDSSGVTTLLGRIVGTLASGTHNPQTGDSYAIVNHASYGNAQLVRSTTPANTLAVDSNHLVAVPSTQQVDVNTVKTKTITCASNVTILANLGFAGAPGASNGAPTTNGTKLNQTVDLTSGQSIACSDKTGFSLAASQHVIVDSGTVTTLTNLPAITTDWLTATGIKADAVTKIQNGLATPTNITAGTITTVTNLTNAPTSGDLTSTMKSSVTTAANAATPTVTISDKTGFSLSASGIQAIWDALTSALSTAGSIGKRLVDYVDAAISSRSTYAGGAVASVTGNVGGNVTGSVGSVTSAVTVGTNNDKTGYSLAASQHVIADSVPNVTVGGYATGHDPATLILVTPANKISTDAANAVKIQKMAVTLSNADITGNVSSDIKAISTGVDFTDVMKNSLSSSAPELNIDDIKDAIADLLSVDALAELDSIPGISAPLSQKIQFLFQYFRNQRVVTSSQENLYKDNGTLLGSGSVSDDGAALTKGKLS